MSGTFYAVLFVVIFAIYTFWETRPIKKNK